MTYLVVPDATMATYGSSARMDERDDRGAPRGTPCVLAFKLDDEFMRAYRDALRADAERQPARRRRRKVAA